MAKKLILYFSLLIFVAGLWAIDDAGITQNSKGDAGNVLLERLIGMFQTMAATGSGGKNKVNTEIEGIMAETKKAFSETKIDPYFFRHFHRILLVIKLTIVEDQQGILGPLIEREAEEFASDMMGVQKGRETSSIGVLAEALQQGILNLQLYLDTKDQRQKLMEEWEKKFEPTEKKTKK
jgi:hypothetical protein